LISISGFMAQKLLLVIAELGADAAHVRAKRPREGEPGPFDVEPFEAGEGEDRTTPPPAGLEPV
jgi:hypothetical protein